MFARSLSLLCLCAVLHLAPPAHGQEIHVGHDEVDHEAVDHGVPLYGTLGAHSRSVTTSSERAQAYFDEGMQLMYAFGTSTARRSFQAARQEDPECAMCWWGEAWSLSPYLNGRPGPSAEREARERIQRARELAPGRTDAAEEALIEAMAVRFSEEPEEGRAHLDSLYAQAMEDVARRFPDDLDVQTLHAESLMLLRPRRGPVDLADPSVREITDILEEVLDRDLKHPGACHLYIHLVEASAEPERAEACSDHLADAIPGASHIQHMPSHIYMTIGRYGDAVRGNLRARHVDEQAEHGGVPGIYRAHNLHMLVFAAVFDGQSAIAIDGARELARMSEPQSFYLPLTLAIFGRWDDVLALHERPRDEFREGMWHWARGMAHLRTGLPGSAGDNLRLLRHIEAEIPKDRNFRFHPQRVLLSIAGGILEGELEAARGDEEAAIRVLQEAIAAHDGLVYDEPAPWHLPPRLTLGALLVDMDRAAEAESVYRKALTHHPNLGWALFGLEQALRAQGREAEADEAAREFEEAWARSDTWLRSSRF